MRDEDAATTHEGMADTAIATSDTTHPIARDTPPLGTVLPPSGYQLHELIGKGGMGEVMAATDERIGRDVAIKRMRHPQPDAEHLARFLREARIQARLDHPAIVPVHELGTDPAGRPYFVMKRITGRTMGQHLTDGSEQRRLLRTLVDVSLAIDLAHSRGVIHRDLKPANIMLGDYGEVYVLDWGVARVTGENESAAPIRSDVDTLDDGTQTGAMLGTPGYMAPEVIKGEPAQAAADVYALGCTLFEILAAEALHPRGTGAIASTLTQPQELPARRRPDRAVPPELDRLCFEALAERPLDRPTARQFADRLQSYLDGDRDIARRRELAREQLGKAREALAVDEGEGRSEAIARAGRALALAPDWAEASELVAELTVRPPAKLPRALEDSLAEEERASTRQRSRTALKGLQALLVSWLVIPFLGLQSWPWMVATYAALVLHSFYVWRGTRTGLINIPVGLASAMLFVVLASRLAGIWIITPVLMCGTLLGFTSSTLFLRHKWIIPVWTSLAFAIPILLERIGFMPVSWDVQLERIVNISTIFRMEGWYADAALIACNVVLVIVVGIVAVRLQHAARRARRQLSIQNWHMNQLVPSSRRTWATQPNAVIP